MGFFDIILAKNLSKGGGSGGTSNYNELTNKPRINNVELTGDCTLSELGIDIPTKTSELTNDSDFITSTECDQKIAAELENFDTLDYEVVQTLPQVGENGVRYLVPVQGENRYREYAYINGTWYDIGITGEIDLSNYYTKTEADTLLNGKVDKIAGKGLSTNDFTNTDKTQITTNKDDISDIEDGTADIELTITDAEITAMFNEVFGDLLPGKVDLDTVLAKGNTSDKNIVLSGDGSTALIVESTYSTTEIESGSVRVTASDGTSNGLDASVGGLGIYSESGDISGSTYLSGTHINMGVFDSSQGLDVGMFSMDVQAHYLDMDDDLKEAWKRELDISSQQNAINVLSTNGAKNILHNISKNFTSNGISYTLNADGSITANGTATDLSQYLINTNFNLPIGSYIFSGCPAGGSTTGSGYYMVARNDTAAKAAHDTGEGCVFDVTNATDLYRFRIMISAGVTVNNLTFYPMIRAAGITDSTYAMYSRSNAELTKDVAKCVEKSDTGWVTLSGNVLYRTRDNTGWVYLYDAIPTDVNAAWSVLGELPDGSKPDGTYYYAIPINNNYGNLKIASSGEISINSPSGAAIGSPLRGLASFPLANT